MHAIDLDANATTPLAPEVLEAMRPHWRAGGNPESRHQLGRASRRAWEKARGDIARILGADSSEVLFTSGGTEANNLALFGLLARQDATAHAVTSPIEHPAVAAPLKQLQQQGVELTTLKVARNGVMEVDDYRAAFRSETKLAALMLANNETGALQPVAELAEAASAHGILVHTDAVQAVGRVPVDFHRLGVATLAASAHKLHGPPGIGVLVVRKGTILAPQLFGGGQQATLRPGTPAVALAVGMAEALNLWQRQAELIAGRQSRLRDHLEHALVAAIGRDQVVRHGPRDERLRLPQTLCLGFPGLDANALLLQFDLTGICVSIGSACASGTTQPSPTLVAMNVEPNALKASLRFSLNAFTDDSIINQAIEHIVPILQSARESHAPTQ
jgi:cysteine desulfurase